MPGNAQVVEARGQPLVNTLADFSCALVGYSSDSAVDAGEVSPAYSKAGAAAADMANGDMVDACTQMLAQPYGLTNPPPVLCYTTPATTPGSYGTIDVTGVVGTAVITNDTGTPPTGTYQPWMKVVAGGLIGVTGMTAYASLDNGRTKKLVSLGTTLGYAFPSADGWGAGGQAGFSFAPSTTNAAYVTLAVELRADTLAHLANVTAHDAADTSAAQIALAASSVPATVTASTAVVNLVLAALVSHVPNITAHDGPDLVAYTALAALSAATTTKEGIDLAIALKGIINTHEGVALTASTAGLMGATASIASPTTYTAASNFLAGGVAAMDAQPRRVKITISGSGTPANMADSVTITGFDYADNAQTESGLSLTGLGTVISTKAFKGTGLSTAYVAADGTAASFQTGYSNGVHNSADVTNTISAADPTYGTLIAGDVFFTSTKPPQWDVADLYTAQSGPTDASGALVALAQSPQLVGRVVITEPMAADDFTTIKAGVDYALGLGRHWRIIARFRDPDEGESDAAYIEAFQAFVAACLDSRFTYLAGNGLMSDAFTGRVYLRTFMAAYLARLQSMIAFPGLKGERLAQNAGWVDRGPLEGFSLRDADGNPVGHDEAQRGGIVVAPGAPTGGGVACYYQTSPQRQGTYIDNRSTVAYDVGESILTPQDRDVANALEALAVGIMLGYIGGADIVGDGSPRTMDDDIAQALEGQIQKAAKDFYGREFANADDPNLVTVDTTVIVSGANVAVTGEYNAKFYAYGDTFTLTFRARR